MFGFDSILDSTKKITEGVPMLTQSNGGIDKSSNQKVSKSITKNKTSGGGSFSLSGNDWLGIGAATNKEGTGVEGCGVRPNCLFGSDCNRSKERFDECVKRQQELNFLKAQNESRVNSSNSNNSKWIFVILGIIIIVLIIKFAK